MSFHGVHLSHPPSSAFQFPPNPEPLALPPPAPGSTLNAPPFAIPADIFNSVLDVRVPITIASVYAITVSLVNRYNRSRGNKAWPVSKTKPFFWFVVLHNVFLAVYSAWTFVGMLGALRRTVQRPSGPGGLVGTVDSLCKIHGVSGLGNAVAYNQTTESWAAQSHDIHLASNGLPDSTDRGRLWNEGLAFYGWWFYLSKFYEVLDTVIILAKGKRSSTLQTYHHAGAMMCMWAGIRYMSPPIWMFCFVNSFIHALMYTYYTLTAFSVPVPNALKQSLTTMQITQFLVGVVYAGLHSFVSYTVPVRVRSPIFASASSAASVAYNTASSAVAAVATDPTVADRIKRFLFRAAGEGGVAENVVINSPHSGPSYSNNHPAPKGKEDSWTTEHRTVSCVDTQGQTFAIWLNVLYLTPLTFLFVRFFVKSYITRTIGKNAKQKVKAVENSREDATKGIDRKVNGHAGSDEKANDGAKASTPKKASKNGKKTANVTAGVGEKSYSDAVKQSM